MPSNHLFLCCPLFLLPSIFPSIRVFSNESACRTGGPKYWSFIFSISPSNEHSGLISFRMGWLDLLAVQGTLKGLLQQHRSKASILRHSAFFIVTLTSIYDYWKTIALTRLTFVGKVMSPLLNILSRLVITFLPRSKRLLISWLQSPSVVILEPPKNKVSHYFHCFAIYSRVQLFVTPWTITYQAPPTIGFSRQEHWSGVPFTSSGDLPDPGIKPGSPALQADALPSEPPGKLKPG